MFVYIKQICKRMQKLIDYSTESKLSIELASECLALAPWNNIPAATLLDRLRRSREAWRTLRPTRVETISLHGDTYLTYEVCGYVFGQGKPSQIGPHPLEEDPFATRMLEFWEMPVGGLTGVEVEVDGEGEGKGENEGESEGTRGWHRKYVDMGMDIVDFTLDPSQDALFFVEKQGFVDSLSPPLLHHYLQLTPEDRDIPSTCEHYPAICTIQTPK